MCSRPARVKVCESFASLTYLVMMVNGPTSKRAHICFSQFLVWALLGSAPDARRLRPDGRGHRSQVPRAVAYPQALQ